MGFLTHSNLPETLGGFLICLHGQCFALFTKFLVCYNGYQGLSWIKISSRFLFYVKSYIDSTIQILKMICLRRRGEQTLMKKCCFLEVVFCLFFELICNLFFWADLLSLFLVDMQYLFVVDLQSVFC